MERDRNRGSDERETDRQVEKDSKRDRQTGGKRQKQRSDVGRETDRWKHTEKSCSERERQAGRERERERERHKQ